MATLAISKNTGGLRFFVDTIAAGVVRDVDGNVAVFKAHGDYFLDVQTGQIYGSGAAPGPTNAYVFSGNPGITDNDSYDGASWTSKTNMSYGRYSPTAFTLGATAYVCGGKGAAVVKTSSSWDGTSWGSITDMPNPARYTCKGVVIGTIGYSFCGYTGSSNLADNDGWDGSAWAGYTSVPTARNSVGASYIGAVAYCIGGSGLSVENNAWNATSWAAATDLPAPARDNLCAETLSGVLTTYGGYSGSRDKDVDSFDGTSWTTQTPLAVGRSAIACSNIGASTYISGGYSTGAVSIVQSFDGSAFTTESSLPSPARYASGAASI